MCLGLGFTGASVTQKVISYKAAVGCRFGLEDLGCSGTRDSVRVES